MKAVRGGKQLSTGNLKLAERKAVVQIDCGFRIADCGQVQNLEWGFHRGKFYVRDEEISFGIGQWIW
jgi:hypothetical protein